MTKRVPFTPVWRRLGLILLILIPLSAGYLMGRGGNHQHPVVSASEAASKSEKEPENELWTCSMHPQIQLPEQVPCPLCGMDLIPVTVSDSEEGSAPTITLSQNAQKLAGIVTSTVEKQPAEVEIRLSGKINVDETRVAAISAWIPGRLDRLYVDYTGVYVKAGDPLISLYSPELLTTQEELLQAVKMKETTEGQPSGSFEKSIMANLDAVRKKLSLWGLTDRQIQEIETAGKARDHLTIHSPISGVVIHKTAIEGKYVDTGTQIYTIADLSRLWVILDAYESDLIWLRETQEVELRTEAYPGEIFHGNVAFIDPVLNRRTRTVKIRVNVENPDGKLKPEMFVQSVIKARIGADFKVATPNSGGDWNHGDPLMIPVSAPLRTGQRAVVYIADKGRTGSYSGREVILGPRAGEYYIVLNGLDEGEEIVVRGNFKIDSAAQIMAQPSMMDPGTIPGVESAGETSKPPASGSLGLPGEAIHYHDIPESFKTDLSGLYQAYFEIQNAFSHDELASAAEAAAQMQRLFNDIDANKLSEEARIAWSDSKEPFAGVIRGINASNEIETARELFEPLSQWVTWLVRSFGSSTDQPILRYNCPMAFDSRGADWLQSKPGTENPYYGSAMFKCGTEEEVIWAGQSHKDEQHDASQ